MTSSPGQLAWAFRHQLVNAIVAHPIFLEPALVLHAGRPSPAARAYGIETVQAVADLGLMLPVLFLGLQRSHNLLPQQ